MSLVKEKKDSMSPFTWLSGGEREILYKVIWQHQAPKKALQELEDLIKAEQCRAVAELAVQLESELS